MTAASLRPLQQGHGDHSGQDRVPGEVDDVVGGLHDVARLQLQAGAEGDAEGAAFDDIQSGFERAEHQEVLQGGFAIGFEVRDIGLPQSTQQGGVHPTGPQAGQQQSQQAEAEKGEDEFRAGHGGGR